MSLKLVTLFSIETELLEGNSSEDCSSLKSVCWLRLALLYGNFMAIGLWAGAHT